MQDLLINLPIFDGIGQLIRSGGVIVAILLALSVFVTTIIIVKLWQFLWSGVLFQLSSEMIIQKWISGDHSTAYNQITKRNNPTAKVLAHVMRGLQDHEKDDKLVREDIERVASKEISDLRSFFPAIEAIVQIAPLLGLFGTVIGMIEAFQNLQSAGTEVDPSILAGGIWVALLTTAVGLAIAIPSALILYWFESLVDGEQKRMEIGITSLLTKRLTDEKRQTINIPPAKSVSSINNAA